jgi:hypothetical protein
VRERLAERPLAGGRWTVEQRIVEPGEEAAQIPERGLRQPEDARTLRRRTRCDDDGALLLLERVIERVPDVEGCPAERPALAREIGVGQRRQPAERRIEAQDRTRASIPESRSMTLMIARLP